MAARLLEVISGITYEVAWNILSLNPARWTLMFDSERPSARMVLHIMSTFCFILMTVWLYLTMQNPSFEMRLESLSLSRKSQLETLDSILEVSFEKSHSIMELTVGPSARHSMYKMLSTMLSSISSQKGRSLWPKHQLR